MHPFSILTVAIFIAGYITARWDLVTRLYELAVFAWDHGVIVHFSCKCTMRTAKGFTILSTLFLILFLPIEKLASRETALHPRSTSAGISAREQLKRRGSF
ncbi:Membrane protein [Golovinomyces cichoracearum]|uniref:Membrane protein n=1 Tax=Golovinomyces cichoracearum TaxID=62708 RepID=A0A420HNB8_9PEZI|nr:Membrane protein [Golovinomyces cichoracearum]